MQDYEWAPGPIAAQVRGIGLRSGVGTPITVEGGLWGVIIAGWTHEDYLAAVPAMKGKEAFLAENIALYIEYVYKDQAVPGAMDRERLSRVQKFYVSQGIVAKESALDELYTNQFVQQ